jgi:hypothetical protein
MALTIKEIDGAKPTGILECFSEHDVIELRRVSWR